MVFTLSNRRRNCRRDNSKLSNVLTRKPSLEVAPITSATV